METRSERNIIKKKIKKKRLNIARTLVVVLVVYIIVCVGIHLYQQPVKNYVITGNSFLTDVDIIRELNLEDYPSFVSINTKKLKKELENNVYIKKAEVKYHWDFTLSIEIEENTPMLFMKLDGKVCLADGTLVDATNDNSVGIPILLNTTTDEALKNLAVSLSELDEGVLYLINDIEYKPSYNSSNQVIDSNRFLLSMNDKNMVYVNAKRLKSMNKYLDIIATNKITSNGTLYLDGTEDNYFFKKFE